MPTEISKTTMTTMEQAEVTAYHALTTLEDLDNKSNGNKALSSHRKW
jgi:hypothetical protein